MFSGSHKQTTFFFFFTRGLFVQNQARKKQRRDRGAVQKTEVSPYMKTLKRHGPRGSKSRIIIHSLNWVVLLQICDGPEGIHASPPINWKKGISFLFPGLLLGERSYPKKFWALLQKQKKKQTQNRKIEVF